MSLTKEAKEIIRTLEENRFYAECPCCKEPILLKDAGLFYLEDFSPDAEKLYQQKVAECKLREKQLRAKRNKISEKSEVATTAINIGFISERIVPYNSQDSLYETELEHTFRPQQRPLGCEKCLIPVKKVPIIISI